MFTDMSVSSDLNKKIQQLPAKQKSNWTRPQFLHLYVIQAGAWSLGQSCPTDFSVPQELEKSIQRLKDLYRVQFNGRKLAWPALESRRTEAELLEETLHYHHANFPHTVVVDPLYCIHCWSVDALIAREFAAVLSFLLQFRCSRFAIRSRKVVPTC